MSLSFILTAVMIIDIVIFVLLTLLFILFPISVVALSDFVVVYYCNVVDNIVLIFVFHAAFLVEVVRLC